MFEDLKEILRWSIIIIEWAPGIVMIIISIVALVKQRFWIPVFIHLIAYGGAIVTFLVVMTIPRDEPYKIIELLGRLLLFPAAVYGVYIIFGGPLYSNESMAIDRITEILPDEDDPLLSEDNSEKKFPWFIILWLIFCIISLIILT